MSDSEQREQPSTEETVLEDGADGSAEVESEGPTPEQAPEPDHEDLDSEAQDEGLSHGEDPSAIETTVGTVDAPEPDEEAAAGQGEGEAGSAASGAATDSEPAWQETSPKSEEEFVGRTDKRWADEAQLPVLKQALESLIFVSDKVVTHLQLAKLVKAKPALVRSVLGEIAADYAPRGIQLVTVGGGYQFRTNPDCGVFVRELVAQKPVRLTRAQLETLALVAYRQPITRPEVDEVRGVDSGSAVKVLLDRGLIKMLGRKDEAGRPLLYGTTPYFLEFFALTGLKDLPTLKEFTELSDDSRALFKRKTGEAVEEGAPVEGSGLSDAELDDQDDQDEPEDADDATDVPDGDGAVDRDDRDNEEADSAAHETEGESEAPDQLDARADEEADGWSADAGEGLADARHGEAQEEHLGGEGPDDEPSAEDSHSDPEADPRKSTTGEQP